MLMRKGQVYRCQNPRCGAELQVERESIDGFSSPICCCGAEMTKGYEAPALRKVEASPEVMALLKLLAELHGFQLVDKAADPGRADAAGHANAPEPPLEPVRFWGPSADGEGSRPLPLERVCDLHIQHVLEMCDGHRARAAQMLGISRNSLYRTLKRIGQVRRKHHSIHREAADPAGSSQRAHVRDSGHPAYSDQFD